MIKILHYSDIPLEFVTILASKISKKIFSSEAFKNIFPLLFLGMRFNTTDAFICFNRVEETRLVCFFVLYFITLGFWNRAFNVFYAFFGGSNDRHCNGAFCVYYIQNLSRRLTATSTVLVSLAFNHIHSLLILHMGLVDIESYALLLTF